MRHLILAIWISVCIAETTYRPGHDVDKLHPHMSAYVSSAREEVADCLILVPLHTHSMYCEYRLFLTNADRRVKPS